MIGRLEGNEAEATALPVFVAHDACAGRRQPLVSVDVGRETYLTIDPYARKWEKRLLESISGSRFLQNKLQGSMRPLWLFEPGPVTGAICTCCPGPWINGEGGVRLKA